MKTIEGKREVTPQWPMGNGNLGKFTITTKELSGEALLEMLLGDDPERDDIVKNLASNGEIAMADAVADIVNAQVGIRFNGPSFVDAVRKLVRDKKEGEKFEDYFTATKHEAETVAKEVGKDRVHDYVQFLREWKTKVFGKRGEKADKRPVLAEYDSIVNTVTSKWATASEAGRKTYIDKLKLDLATTCTAQEFLAAMSKKYQRPMAVTLDELA